MRESINLYKKIPDTDTIYVNRNVERSVSNDSTSKKTRFFRFEQHQFSIFIPFIPILYDYCSRSENFAYNFYFKHGASYRLQ